MKMLSEKWSLEKGKRYIWIEDGVEYEGVYLKMEGFKYIMLMDDGEERIV